MRRTQIKRGVALGRTLFVSHRHPVTSEKGLIERLDVLTSFIVRKRDGYACVQCGSTLDVTNGHLFSRRYMPTRFDIHPEGNCHCQCWRCNQAHSFNPDPYTLWYAANVGGEAHAIVRDRAFSKKVFEYVELQEMHAEYKLILKGMT